MVIGLCERFGKLPSELENEDAGILKMLEIIRLGTEREGNGGGE